MNWLNMNSKLSCWFYRRQSIAFIEESLSPVPRTAMLNHLSDCPGCREEIRSLQGIMQSVRRSAPPVPRLDPDLWSKLEGRLQAVRPTPSRPIGWGLPSASLASLAVVTIAYMSFAGPGQQSALRHTGKPGGTVMAQLPAGAPSQEPEAAATRKTAASFHAANLAPAAPAKAAAKAKPVTRPADRGPKLFYMTPSMRDEPVFAPTPREEFRGRVADGDEGRNPVVSDLSLVHSAPIVNIRSRSWEVRFQRAAPTERASSPMKIAFYKASGPARLENHADLQRGEGDTLAANANVLDSPARTGRQRVGVTTLAALSPDVIAAVNGAVTAGDEMALRRNNNLSFGVAPAVGQQVVGIDRDSALPDDRPAARSAMALRGTPVVRMADGAPNLFFSEVQTVDRLGRPTATNRIIGQADPAGTVQFTASESGASVGDQR